MPELTDLGQLEVDPLTDHDRPVAEDDAVAKAVDPVGREPVFRYPDIFSVCCVELEWREVVVWRRRALPLELDDSLLHVVLAAVRLTHLEPMRESHKTFFKCFFFVWL